MTDRSNAITSRDVREILLTHDFKYSDGEANEKEITEAKQALYEAVLKCVPEKLNISGTQPRAYNACRSDVLTNLAELFGMGNLAEPKPTNSQPQLADNLHFDPYDFVEPCEPDCSPERHAYHQGQWDMAGRINKAAGISKEGDT